MSEQTRTDGQDRQEQGIDPTGTPRDAFADPTPGGATGGGVVAFAADGGGMAADDEIAADAAATEVRPMLRNPDHPAERSSGPAVEPGAGLEAEAASTPVAATDQHAGPAAHPTDLDADPPAAPGDPDGGPHASPGDQNAGPPAHPGAEPSAPGPRPVPPAARPAPPKPGPPRPGPGPTAVPPRRPTPAAAVPVAPVEPLPATTVSVAPAGPDPSRWGRVDADGTIFVRTADGERVVGSWQAGAPDEGLAHFARRFDDLLTEAELLAGRLAAGGDPKPTLASAKTLRDGLGEATVVGDLAGLGALLDEILELGQAATEAARRARDAQRGEAVAHKEALVAEAEQLATDATQWKQAGDRFKQILDEWRTVRGIDRRTDELLWKRFSKAREGFNRRRGSHFADLDRQRSVARADKERLVVEAEKLAQSDEWAETAARYRDLMTEWKAAGRAQKDTDDALWARFRAAQDGFFARRTAMFAERDTEFAANATAKRGLLDRAEKIDAAGDPDAARAALRAVQEQWEEIGKVPRDDVRPLEARLRAVEERVREAADRQWRRSDPEAEARVAQFRQRVEQFEAQAAKARAAGDDRRATQAEQQAQQWREWLTAAEHAAADR